MISQLPGAGFRALLVVGMVLAPSLLLRDAAPEASDTVLLAALFAGLFTLAEYTAASPGLVEFRAAPPVNRIRFVTLALTAMLLAVACGGAEGASLSRLAMAVGLLLGHAMDFPASPVRAVMAFLPEDATAMQGQALRVAAGLSYLVNLIGLTVFVLVVRLRSWPAADGAFNIWVNLPTFDPSTGTDVVRRLRRDGAVNILLGIVLAYLGPPVAVFVGGAYGASVLQSDLMLVWVMSLWAFLPASLFLRGIAMRRLATMVALRRRRLGLNDPDTDPAFLPA